MALLLGRLGASAPFTHAIPSKTCSNILSLHSLNAERSYSSAGCTCSSSTATTPPSSEDKVHTVAAMLTRRTLGQPVHSIRRPSHSNRRLSSFPGRRKSAVCHSLSRPAVGASLILQKASEVEEPEAELISRQAFERRFAGSHGDLGLQMQTLERLKGDLSHLVHDLEEESEAEISESDRDKLNASRLEYYMEDKQRREERKAQRAAKRAAKKSSSTRTQALSASTAGPSASTSHTSKAGAREARRSVARGFGPKVRGARAAAATRTAAVAKWGKQTQTQTEANSVVDLSMETNDDWNAEHLSGNNSVTDYMRNLTKHTLLTAGEEVQLSIKVKDWVHLERHRAILKRELQRDPSLQEWAAAANVADLDDFKHRMHEGSRARSKMLVCNQRLVISIARRYQDRGLDLADLIQEGMAGLIRGVEKFDHTRGFKFSTYATWWVRQAMTRSISELGRVVRLPVHLHDLLMKVYKEEREHLHLYAKEAPPEVVAERLGISLEKLTMVKQAAFDPRSLDDPLGTSDPDGELLGDVLEDKDAEQPDDLVVMAGMQLDVDSVLHTLTKREHGILRMRYGLDDGQPRTLEEIGTVFHVTRERIRQIENKAMAKLRDPQRHSNLNIYVEGAIPSPGAGWKQGVHRAQH